MTKSNFPVGIGFLAGAATATAACVAVWMVRSFRPQPTDENENDRDIPEELSDCPWAEELRLGVRLARLAGGNMVDYLQAKGTASEGLFDLEVETKSTVADFCTRVDVENERLIADGIFLRYPDHLMIGEESAGAAGTIPPLTDRPTWIVDPIDGTTNFRAGIHSLTCVSIAYCEGGRPVVGVVHVPGTGETYLGVAGYGAYRNGERIRQTPDTSTKTVRDAVVCVEFGYVRDPDNVTTVLEGLAKVVRSGRPLAVRQFGSGCLDLCMVASGRVDVVYAGLAGEGWKPWDYAAGSVIVEEAGCIIEPIDHGPSGGQRRDGFDLYSPSVICGVSRELVDEVRLILSFF